MVQNIAHGSKQRKMQSNDHGQWERGRRIHYRKWFSAKYTTETNHQLNLLRNRDQR